MSTMRVNGRALPVAVFAVLGFVMLRPVPAEVQTQERRPTTRR